VALGPVVVTGARVVVGRVGELTVLNPILYSDLHTGEVVNRMFDHLVLTDDEHRYVPGRLVTGWRSNEDGTVWDFFLRPEARWHDGRPVTADDAVFTFESILDPATGSSRHVEFVVGDRPMRFTAAGPHHLRVVLPGPFAPFLAALAWRPIIPRHVYGGAPLATHPANEHPVGSGPFRFGGRPARDRLIMVGNDDYHLGRPGLDEVEWRDLPDADAAVAGLRRGELDYVTAVPAGPAAELAGDPEFRVVRSVDAAFTYLGFQLAAAPFADVRVRRAINHAVDRERLVREVLGGEGTVAHGPITPASPWHHPGVRRYAYDPARARELLAAARATGLRFTLLTVAGDRMKEQMARRIVEDCAAVGVRVDVSAHPMGTLLREHVYPRRFEAVLMALAPNPDPAFLHAFYHSRMLTPHGWNRLTYGHPVVDDLLERSQVAVDEDERRRLLAQAQELIAEDAPQVFLCHPGVIDVARRGVVVPEPPRMPGNRFMHLHRWRHATPAAGSVSGSR
jgi:peptide/nickel transport system substrate-binding protein